MSLETWTRKFTSVLFVQQKRGNNPSTWPKGRRMSTWAVINVHSEIILLSCTWVNMSRKGKSYVSFLDTGWLRKWMPHLKKPNPSSSKMRKKSPSLTSLQQCHHLLPGQGESPSLRPRCTWHVGEAVFPTGAPSPAALMAPFLRAGMLLFCLCWNTCQNGGCREQLAIGFLFDSDKSPDSQCWLQSSTCSRLRV